MTRKCTEVQTDQSGLLRVCFHPFAVLYSPLRAPWHLKAAFNIYINLLLHQCQLSCEISGLSPPNSNLTHALSRVWWHCHPDPSFFGSYCAVHSEYTALFHTHNRDPAFYWSSSQHLVILSQLFLKVKSTSRKITWKLSIVYLGGQKGGSCTPGQPGLQSKTLCQHTQVLGRSCSSSI